MRIAIVLRMFDGGGAERGAAGWAEGLARRGHEVVALTHEGDGGTPPEGLVHLHRSGWSGPSYWRGLPHWIRSEHEARRFDVVIGVLEFSNLAVLAAFARSRAGAPAVVVSEHNINSLLLSGAGAVERVKLALCRRWYRRADAAVALSHAVATDLVLTFGVASERLFVIPIPPSLLSGVSVNPVRPDRMCLVFVGRLVPQKRPERVLAALDALRGRGVRASAVVVGDGPLRGDLERLASASGHDVTFTGWVSDWRAHARDATCLFLPSDFEGLGLVLVEAAAMGLPSVATSQALAVADALVPGVTGALALSPRPEHLADAVLAAAELRSVAAGGGLADERWLRWFSSDVTAERLEQALDAVVAARGAA
jgi:glycosyltransferase involved in cell wall biosynthesis